MVKATRSSPEASVSCNEYPFFRQYSQRALRSKRLLQQCSCEGGGHLFDECIIVWEAVKELILKGIFEGVQALKFFEFLDVSKEVVFLNGSHSGHC